MRPLVTFDCFDTVITRAVGGSRGASHVLAEALRREAFPGLAGVPAEVVVAAHLRAEHLAYSRYGERRSLAHSSAQLAELLGLPPTAAAGLRAAEEAVELALNRPVPAGLRAVRAARAGGAQVGFLSDTAVSGELLGTMLRRCGALEDGDLLWASNELGAEKGRGRAYRAVLASLEPSQRPARGTWRHSGDDARSDGLMARLSGVRASVLPTGRLTGTERLLERAAPSTGGASSALAGAARRARLVLGDDGARTAVVTGVLGPVLAGLTAWALPRARAEGLGLHLAGPGATALAAVAVPLAAVLDPGAVVRVVDRPLTGGPADLDVDPSAGALVLTAGVAPAGAAGLHLAVDAAPGGAGSLRASAVPKGPGVPGATTTGYLRDGAAGTGLSGARVVGADVAAALAAAAGPDEVAALAAFATELAGVLPLLVDPGSGRALPDLREVLDEVLHRLWSLPGADAARAWHPVLGALPSGWPAGVTALAPTPERLVRRAAAAAAGRGGPKLARARSLTEARWSGRGRPG